MAPGAASLALQGTGAVESLQHIVSPPVPHCYRIIVGADEALGEMWREDEAVTTVGWSTALDGVCWDRRWMPAGHLGDHKADQRIVVDDPACRPPLARRRIVPTGRIHALHHGVKTAQPFDVGQQVVAHMLLL
jgi:hypothetical protein